MCASWEAGTKESITCGCQPERTGEGEAKNTSNCCRRIEETPARHSLEAAWLHAWSQLPHSMKDSTACQGTAKKLRIPDSGNTSSVNTLNTYGNTIGEGRESN